MTMPDKTMDPDETGMTNYRICVAGVLGQEWSERTHGMTVSRVTNKSGGECTALIGGLPDEAALMGILDTLYSRGARLLSVERIDPDGSRAVDFSEPA